MHDHDIILHLHYILGRQRFSIVLKGTLTGHKAAAATKPVIPMGHSYSKPGVLQCSNYRTPFWLNFIIWAPHTVTYLLQQVERKIWFWTSCVQCNSEFNRFLLPQTPRRISQGPLKVYTVTSITRPTFVSGHSHCKTAGLIWTITECWPDFYLLT